MEEPNIFDRLERVKAPEGFEAGVLAELPRRKERRSRVLRTYQFAFAGGTAVVLATFVLVNVFVLRKPEELIAAEPVQVMETMDYSAEVHNTSYDPQTIYILEQVSEASPQEITY